MVERIDKWEGGCAVECSAIVQGGSDTDRCLVDIWDTEIDFPHDGVTPQIAGKGGVGVVSDVSAVRQQ